MVALKLKLWGLNSSTSSGTLVDDNLISCTLPFICLVEDRFWNKGRFCIYVPPEAEAVLEEGESQDPLFDLETSQESEKPGSKRLRIFFHAFSQVASSEGTVGTKAVCGFKICHYLLAAILNHRAVFPICTLELCHTKALYWFIKIKRSEYLARMN